MFFVNSIDSLKFQIPFDETSYFRELGPRWDQKSKDIFHTLIIFR